MSVPAMLNFSEEVAGENWTGECALYAFNSGTLSRMAKNGKAGVTLGILQSEIYTISPIREYNQLVDFALIGLVDMYNSGGAVEAMNCTKDSSLGCKITIKAKGSGRFGAYSRTKPKYCSVDAKEKKFTYDVKDGFLTLELPTYLQGESNSREAEIVY